MSWREYAKQVQGAGHNRHDRHESPGDDAVVPVVPIVPVAPFQDPARVLKVWHSHLSALDFNRAPEPFELNRWRQIVEDAHWLYETWAAQLVRDGWSAHDIFGVLPWLPGGGVLLDRLQGARNLKLEGGKAYWSWPWSSVVMQTCRGAGDGLVSSGLVLAWEIGK